ncbi:NAD(P)-dependent oxidoreductase [Rubrobacter taiwanensis]|jgi:2-hydroxy-3-oxopropionate reductase|uniref:NAD(P)-dependent oxidoreductase n=1 Tax=Rubrobacter taiwanensis TaxID=185139 RepID=A0A4R1BEF3_9ACTN|nr:NAD(P)-dependent oxidoreductase [Rubrobacter taiwanensis]TCJ15457.1 NAD(P)-dependent oxidoreductase [Rubrobacter taiwanensis]
MRVGFIGLGIMGAPMARNLAEAGYRLTVHNRSPRKAEKLAGETGAAIASSPAETAGRCDAIITMLPGPPEVEAVATEAMENARPGTLLIDMSTSSPELARKLWEAGRERGVGLLDAPVSGGDVGAVEGRLSIMVGGEEEDFRRARPLFEVLGETIVHAGPAGAGQITKAANQVVVALVIQAVSEALVLGTRGGVGPEKIFEVLEGGLASNKVLEVKREKLLGRSFEPGGKVEFHRKDLGIALEAAREHGAVLPGAALVQQLFCALAAKGRAGWDHSALLTLLEDLSERGNERP